MLVDVVELRHKGQKLPRDYVRLSTPVRGDLSIGTRIGDSAGELVPFAFLSEVDSTRTVLPGLDYAVCMPMRGDHFLVRGRQEFVDRKVRREYPQAWWCRVVHEPVPRPASTAHHRPVSQDEGSPCHTRSTSS